MLRQNEEDLDWCLSSNELPRRRHRKCTLSVRFRHLVVATHTHAIANRPVASTQNPGRRVDGEQVVRYQRTLALPQIPPLGTGCNVCLGGSVRTQRFSGFR